MTGSATGSLRHDESRIPKRFRAVRARLAPRWGRQAGPRAGARLILERIYEPVFSDHSQRLSPRVGRRTRRWEAITPHMGQGGPLACRSGHPKAALTTSTTRASCSRCWPCRVDDNTVHPADPWHARSRLRRAVDTTTARNSGRSAGRRDLTVDGQHLPARTRRVHGAARPGSVLARHQARREPRVRPGWRTGCGRRATSATVSARTPTRTRSPDADAKVADLARQMRSLPSKDAFDPTYRRAWYARYADDFLLGTVGTKEEALGLKSDDHRVHLTNSTSRSRPRRRAWSEQREGASSSWATTVRVDNAQADDARHGPQPDRDQTDGQPPDHSRGPVRAAPQVRELARLRQPRHALCVVAARPDVDRGRGDRLALQRRDPRAAGLLPARPLQRPATISTGSSTCGRPAS